MDKPLFVIWSIEHQAWWGPDRIGYTRHLIEAGIYARDEAAAIVAGANVVHCHECMIPLECLADPPTGAAQHADGL